MRSCRNIPCPSCERPVTDGMALCPYCGEPLPGRHKSSLACLVLIAPVILNAALGALLARPLPWEAVADALGFGYGRPLSSVLSGLAALLLFLPPALAAPGAPLPIRLRDVVFGILWRLALLVDGALFGALLAEGAAKGGALLFPGALFAVCAGAFWRFRLGWRALAAFAAVALGPLV